MSTPTTTSSSSTPASSLPISRDSSLPTSPDHNGLCLPLATLNNALVKHKALVHLAELKTKILGSNTGHVEVALEHIRASRDEVLQRHSYREMDLDDAARAPKRKERKRRKERRERPERPEREVAPVFNPPRSKRQVETTTTTFWQWTYTTTTSIFTRS